MKTYNNYGELVNTMVSGPVVTLMFASPTGGVYETRSVDMLCVDNTQAMEIEKRHREAWGIDMVDRATDAERQDLEAMQGVLAEP